MADIQRVPLGVSEKERTEIINSNFDELELRGEGYATLDENGKVNEIAKTADKAKNYDATGGSIKEAFDSVNAAVMDIVNGNTTVGKAKALDPDETPSANMYYGTNEHGQQGFHPLPKGDGEDPALSTLAFTVEDWTKIGNYYVYTHAHNNKYPVGVYKNNSGEYEQVVVDIKRDATNVKVTSDAPFIGALLMG